MADDERSYEAMDAGNLHRLIDLSRKQLEDLFARKPYSGRFREALRFMALCQGAADHYRNGTSGIKDFDVWCFFTRVDGDGFPPRLVLNADFGPSKFGRRTRDGDEYLGRRIDIMGRSLDFAAGTEASDRVQAWLRGPGKSPEALRRKSMIGLWPEPAFGRTLWPRDPA